MPQILYPSTTASQISSTTSRRHLDGSNGGLGDLMRRCSFPHSAKCRRATGKKFQIRQMPRKRCITRSTKQYQRNMTSLGDWKVSLRSALHWRLFTWDHQVRIFYSTLRSSSIFDFSRDQDTVWSSRTLEGHTQEDRTYKTIPCTKSIEEKAQNE